MADFKAADAELCTLWNKTSRDETWKAKLWPTWEHPSEIPSGMGSLEFCNYLIDNSSGTTFSCSGAGLHALCWFGRKDSCEESQMPGGTFRLAFSGPVGTGALWGGMPCSLPTSPAVGTVSLWSQQGKKVWFYCRRSDWTFLLFTYHTPHLVFLKPSVLVAQNTTLSITDCYDFTLTACKISKIPCDTNLPKVSAVPNPFSCIIF